MKTAMLTSVLSLMILATAVALADEPAPAPAPAPAPQEESCEQLAEQYRAKEKEEERVCRANVWSRECIQLGNEMEEIGRKAEAKGCEEQEEE